MMQCPQPKSKQASKEMETHGVPGPDTPPSRGGHLPAVTDEVIGREQVQQNPAPTCRHPSDSLCHRHRPLRFILAQLFIFPAMLSVHLHSYQQIKCTRVCYTLYKKRLRATRTPVRRCAVISKVHASPTRARGAASPPTWGSGGERLDVPEHLVEGLRRGRISVLEGGLDPAVQAEGLQFQPQKAKTVLVEQDEDAGGALGARKAVTSDEACAVKTREGRDRQTDIRRAPAAGAHTAQGTPGARVHMAASHSHSPHHHEWLKP